MNKKKNIIIISVIIGIVLLLGVTFAWFNYYQEGSNHKMIMSDLYLNLDDGGDEIVITNVYPLSTSEARARNDNYKDFTISGKNTSNQDIYYEIKLIHGNVVNNLDRINDEDLVFDLVEIGQNNEETYIVDAKSYSSINDIRIWVETVNKGTTTEITKTYRLRVWVRDDILISDTDPNRTYCATDNCVTGEKSFNNHFASVKIAVFGDFQEKDLPGAYNMLKKNADKTTQINFGNISSDTNGKGIYEIKDENNNSIYYYRGEVNNNNVVFGDFCWQMVRTTDTGGIKMIYNGLATKNGTSYECNNTAANNRQLATTKAFNTNSQSMSDVGYMYNKRYPHQSKSTLRETILSSTSLNTTYWYADSVTWGSPTANRYNLNSPYQVSSTTDYPNLVGKYTFRNTSQTYTNSYVYYIAAVNNTTMYYIELSNTGNHTLADFNYTLTYGDGYRDLGNGTYEITDTTTVTTINRSDWYTNYSNLTNKYVCKNATNNTCSEVRYVTSAFDTSMTYIVASNIKFSNGISNYNSTTGTYTLDNDNSVSFWDITNNTNQTSLNNHHYTCWNASGTCTTLSYIYYLLNGTQYYYINLTGGELVEDALYKMTGNATVEVKNRTINQNYNLNNTDSNIKTYIESWFKTNLTNEEDNSKINYQEYLEDTIYCNDRSYTQRGNYTLALSGWNPNGGSVISYIYFNTRTRWYNSNWYSTTNKPTFACSNETDSFSVSNEKAKLKYPVGLLTADEIILAGAAGNSFASNNKYYLYTGNYYWALSPSTFSISGANEFNVLSTGYLDYLSVNNTYGVRPVVSLKSEIEFESDGDGTPTNPYVVKYN